MVIPQPLSPPPWNGLRGEMKEESEVKNDPDEDEGLDCLESQQGSA